MKIKTFLSLCITIAIISACQKGFTIETPAKLTNTDSSLLKTYVELDTIGGIDTLLKVTYEYDNLKRLITRKQKLYSDSFYANRYYTYNANDTLANKILEIYFSTSLTNIFYDSSFTFFTRNTNNKIVKDSSIIFSIDQGILSSEIIVSDFTHFNNDSIGRILKTYNPTLNNVERWSYKQIRNGSKIIKETEYNYDDFTNTYSLNRVANFIYDNKYNPLYAEKLNYPVWYSPNNLIYLYTAPNNIISYDDSGYIENTVFTYNTEGHPIVSILSYTGGQQDAVKGIFFYGN